MSQLIKSADDIFKMPMENLNISRDWAILYNGVEKSPIKTSTSTESCDSPFNTKSLTTISKIDICEFFYPTEHSTPNNKLNTRSCGAESSSSSFDAMSFSTTYPNPSSSPENHNQPSMSTDQYDQVPQTAVPTISNMLDLDYTQTYVSAEVYGCREKRRRITKKGIKGLHRIVGFALTEDGIKKKKKIQACSVTILLLAIIGLSVILAHVTGNNFSKNSNNSMSSLNTIPTLKGELRTTTVNATNGLNPVNETTTKSVHDGYYVDNDTDKTMMNDKMMSIINIISKIRDNLRTFPRGANNVSLNTSTKAVPESNDELGHICRTCQVGFEVCMLDEERGTPVCRRAVDGEDPTGCGGLCALETEACRLVERARGVRSCRPLRAACGAGEARCADGACVPRGRRCPRPPRCSPGHAGCECDLSLHFRCGAGESSCLPLARRCDGVVDCLDAYDELNCTRACPHGKFPCNTGGACVANGRFCDGRADCADHSDEPPGCDACTPAEVRCADGRCVRRERVCDNLDDCGDSTDEMNCPKHITPASTDHRTVVNPKITIVTPKTSEFKSSTLTPFVIHKLLMLNLKRSRNPTASVTASALERVTWSNASPPPSVDSVPSLPILIHVNV